MRENTGFTLVELMVVLFIMAFMMTLGIPAYGRWKSKHDVESQTYAVLGDLEYARFKAYSEKTDCRVWWGETNPFNSYRIQTDANGDGDYDDTGDTNTFKSVRRPVTSDGPSGINCNGRGFCEPGILRIASNTGAGIDCISITQTRIIVGKWSGGNCVPR